MTITSDRVVATLNRRFLVDHPVKAAGRIELLAKPDARKVMQSQPVDLLLPVWSRLVPGFAAELLSGMPAAAGAEVLSSLPPSDAGRIAAQLDSADLETVLAAMRPEIATDIRNLLAYPPESAGRLMNSRAPGFRQDTNARQALEALRDAGQEVASELFVVDEAGRVVGRVLLQDLALAKPRQTLAELARPLVAAIRPVDPEQEVVEVFEQHGLANLPVTDLDGRLLGVINESTLLQTAQQDISSDMQAMVGVSRDERALSPPLFAVRKRMPWMQINLLTAFMAAAVVGFFESTIAQFTALAVLLPVVAGQSGNAGAQALAVTMRGLALREITARQWLRVAMKEVAVGLYNGLAVAITCSLGVFLWSQSVGLVLVIASSMILAMVIAGFAGAIVPIMLVRLGQDPAQSSSIVLSTITDIAGFMAFLGIATLLSGML